MRYSELPFRYRIAALVMFIAIMALGAWLIHMVVYDWLPRPVAVVLGWIAGIAGAIYLFVARRRRTDVEL